MKRWRIGGLLVLAFRVFAFGDTQQGVRLKSEVMIQGTVVRLSDLLTPNAPRAVRDTGSGIELCPAPKVGTIRVLNREQILSRLAGVPWLSSQLMIPARVTIESRGWPVTEATVRDALNAFLNARGATSRVTADSRLEMPYIAASNPNYHLLIMGIRQSLPDGKLDVHIRCSNSNVCRDFLVSVPLAGGSFPIQRKIPHVSERPALTVARGEQADLILSGSNTRISMPVICLESGALNERVRVLDKRNQKVYLAEVLGQHLVHANL